MAASWRTFRVEIKDALQSRHLCEQKNTFAHQRNMTSLQVTEPSNSVSEVVLKYVAAAAGSRAIAGSARVTGTSSLTGFGTSETALAIARDGTLFFSSAHTADGYGVLRSRDNGATWAPLIPILSNGIAHGRTQPFMYLEPTSERLFFHTSVFNAHPLRIDIRRHRGFHLSYSDDHGETWQGTTVARDALDWGKLMGGPAAAGLSSPDGRAVLYFSAPSPFSTPIPPFDTARKQVIRRSLDGGETWARVGELSLRARDIPGCHPREWVIFGNGFVCPDGTLFIGLRRGPRLGLAVSRDGGSTWDVSDVPSAQLMPYRHAFQILYGNPNYLMGDSFCIDAAYNIYALWPGPDQRLWLAVSRDLGATWTEPVVASAPGVTHVRCSALTSNAKGSIAIAYYGSTDGVRFQGYIAESKNALDKEPHFNSVTIDDPSDPLFPNGFDGGYPRLLVGGDLVEYVQIKYHPNGDIWASFAKDMRGKWPTRKHARSRYQGVAGRLVHR